MCEMLNLAARSFIIGPYVNVEGRKNEKWPYLLTESRYGRSDTIFEGSDFSIKTNLETPKKSTWCSNITENSSHLLAFALKF